MMLLEINQSEFSEEPPDDTMVILPVVDGSTIVISLLVEEPFSVYVTVTVPVAVGVKTPELLSIVAEPVPFDTVHVPPVIELE